MIRERWLPLPDHAGIQVRVLWVGWGVRVEYRGELDALLCTGCISPLIRDAITSAKRSSKDEDGRSFGYRKLPTKRQPGRYEIIRSLDLNTAPEVAARNEAAAQALPGVSALLPQAKRDYEDARRPSTDNEGGFKMRDRCIGRFQRRVRWAVQDWLIVPKWSQIRADWLQAQLLK